MSISSSLPVPCVEIVSNTSGSLVFFPAFWAFFLLNLAYQSLNPLLPLEQWELAVLGHSVPVEICQCNTGGWQTSSANTCMSKANIPSTQTHYVWLGNIVKLNSFWVCFNPDCFNTAHGIFCSLLGLSQTIWRGSFNHIALISFTLTF